MKAAIIVALLMILAGGVIGFDHQLLNPNLAEIAAVPSLTQTVTSVPINYGSNNYGSLSVATEIKGTYYYQNTPYIASSYTPSGSSTYFAGYTYLNWTLQNNCPSTTYSTTVLTVVVNYNVFLASNPSFDYNYGSQQYTLTVRNSPTSLNGNPGWYSGEVITTSPNPGVLFTPMTIAGEQNGVVEVKTSFSVSASPPNADGFQNFNNPSGTVISEAAILPSGASLSPPTPNPVVEGNYVDIQYQTQFGAGDGYFLQIHGSSAYDGGVMVKNISLGDNIQSSYNYLVPSNAFILGATGTGNEWFVDMYDNNFELITQTVFTVNSTNTEPTAPTIQLLSSPQGTGNTWQIGQQMELKITGLPNKNTGNPISNIIVNVFTASSESEPQLYVIQNDNMSAHNGTVYVNFTLPDTPQNLYITAQSVDSEGIASSVSVVSISSLEITHKQPPANNSLAWYWSLIAIVVAIIGAMMLFWYGGVELTQRIILIIGYISMIFLIYIGYGGIY
jgi:hypothetical protein